MGFSVSVDWTKDYEKWTNHGRRIAQETCTHYTQEGNKEHAEDEGYNNVNYSGWCEECDVSEDSQTPMMSYAYPLETKPDDERIKQVIQKTCLTVMENEESGVYYLALCGGGMDLSQNIAMAYYLAERWIPFELCVSVSTQRGLNFDGEDFETVMKAVKESLESRMLWGQEKIDSINKVLGVKA